MRPLLIALAFSAGATPAMANDLAQLPQGRDFWRDSPVSRQTDPDRTPPQRFTTTYTEGIARRFGLGDGQANPFEQRPWGQNGPGVGASFQNGTPAIVLRWHPGE